MKATFTLSVFLAVAAARELTHAPVKRHHRMLGKREVPQEHSHEKFLTATREALNLNNPDEIVDPVFGLLGAAAAQQGAGKITDPECLQQATADQAFSNAKEAGNIELMTSALVFRTLERNTLSVGEKSKPCESIQAVNPEIAALQQHQDPASDGAAALNKEITLELARQIASIGGDPLVAIESGTFEPGQIGDPTAAGNTCNEIDDPEGCIFTQNLLVEDATPEEIQAAVADVAVGGGNEDAVDTATDVATTTEAATTTTEAATTTTEAATTTTDVATATDVATTTTSADVVATECPAAVTVTVTVTAATATQTVVVNNGNGNGNGNGRNNRGNNRGNNRVIRIGGNNNNNNNNNNRGNNRGNNGNGVVRIIKLGARWLGM